MESQGAQVTSHQTQVTTLADPRVAPFLDVTQKDKRESPTHFIAEGENVVLRLLASDYRCERVLCVDRKADRIAPHLQAGTELLTAPEKLINQIVGFKFHSGVMGLGVRKAPARLSSFLPLRGRPGGGLERETAPAEPSSPLLTSPGGGGTNAVLLVLPEITDGANLGALLRIAAGFGVAGVLLGERCRDPFIRQTVRVSMGTIFSLRLMQSQDIRADLRALRSQGMELMATVLDADAEPLPRVACTKPTGLLLGNEGPGLDRDIVELCDRRITLPMQLGTDSLNVAVACGVFLYHLTTGAPATP